MLARLPEWVPADLVDRIEERSVVVGDPVDWAAVDDATLRETPPGAGRAEGPVIVWNHRWEHDKDPEAFFDALATLAERGVPFRVAVCGERYREAPPIFESARRALGSRVVHWGYAATRDDYQRLLQSSHIAVSTAWHEFFGVAMLEATWHGARPVVPDRLAYPELFPPEYRYGDGQLVDELERLCRAWTAGDGDLRADRRAICEPHSAASRLPAFGRLFREVGELPPA